MITITRAILTIGLLVSGVAQSQKPKAKVEYESDKACGSDMVAWKALVDTMFTIQQQETSGLRADALEALKTRRLLQKAPKCYKYLQDNLGLGRSPVTGE